MLKLKDQVEIILKDYPKTRDSDITLMIEIWKKFYKAHIKVASNNEFGIYLSSLYTLPTQERIKRVRAIVQNDEHRFLPTEEKVRRQRRISEDEWKTWVLQQSSYKRI